MPIKKPRCVVIRVTLDRGLFHEMVNGIVDYARQHGRWDLHLDPVPEARSGWLDAWYRDADGVLSALAPERLSRYLGGRQVPVVQLGEQHSPGPAVVFQDQIVGEMAYEHLHSLGLRTIAFCGMPGLRFSDQRLQGALRAAQRHRAALTIYPGNAHAARAREGDETARLIGWIQGLPKPAGLIAATTGSAHDIATFCRSCAIRIPEDLAVLGVDPDDLTSELSTPQLSYIDQGARRLGFEGAALLDRIMQGQTPPSRPAEVPPKGIIARRSTDVLAIDDPDLAQALRFVRDNACQPLTVAQILQVVPMARRTLERGFMRVLGRTVHDEITRLRIERARQLLAETNLSMPQIALACGFEHASSLSAVFTSICGTSAREYRKSAASLPRA